MKAWIISDTHGLHDKLVIPLVDMVIHAGDAGTYKNPSMNVNGVLDFLAWYRHLGIPNKILIAGNHDGSIEKGLIPKSAFDGIHYLQHEAKTIAGLKFFGSPYTPSFNDWAFNISRNQLEQYWKDIPEDTDILVTHGPPKGILDLTMDQDGHPFQCGCKALWNRVKRIQPKFQIFGHIHEEADFPNAAMMNVNGLKTTFINAAVVNLQYQICNNGFVIDI